MSCCLQQIVGHAATTFYDKNGTVLRKFEVPVKHPPTSLRIFRDEIGRLLIDEAQRLHPGKISFRFSTPVVAVNLDLQTVRVANDSDHNDVKEVMNQHYICCCVTLLPACASALNAASMWEPVGICMRQLLATQITGFCQVCYILCQPMAACLDFLQYNFGPTDLLCLASRAGSQTHERPALPLLCPKFRGPAGLTTVDCSFNDHALCLQTVCSCCSSACMQLDAEHLRNISLNTYFKLCNQYCVL